MLCITHAECRYIMKKIIVLLQCHFFQGRSVSVGVSMKKSVVGVYTCVPSATVRLARRIVWSHGPIVGERVVCVRGVYGRA